MPNYTALFITIILIHCAPGSNFERIKYNNDGLVVDLGVGLWAQPIPVDWDGDGDNDLLVCCPDTPSNSIYLFENTQGNVKMPIFKKPVRTGIAYSNLQPSYVHGRLRLLNTNYEVVEYKESQFNKTVQIYPTAEIYQTDFNTSPVQRHKYSIRANQWKYVDLNGDGIIDIIAAVEDWSDYGWDNAFDRKGDWIKGPLHGYIYYLKNIATNDKPSYLNSGRLKAQGNDIDVYGRATPSFYDFDNDDDLDIICGEFIDSLTYFENVGTINNPSYACGKKLSYQGETIQMHVQMIAPVAFDWDKDSDADLIIGDEDGRVALVENTGKITNGMPEFLPPKYFQQEAYEVKFGALITPFSVDWDDDGDEDLICGNSAGNIAFIENITGSGNPKWAALKLLTVDNEPIRITAGKNGSIQGPCERKWGYTVLSVADWDHDGLKDIIVNSIWGKVIYFRNIGKIGKPVLARAKPITIKWADKPQKPVWNWWDPQDNELVTQWRTTPLVIDLDKDGLNDLVMLDTEGYLAFYRRVKENDRSILMPPERIFKIRQKSSSGFNIIPLRLNSEIAGKSGRRKFCMVDWDHDGKLDLMVNSKNVNFLRNVSNDPCEFIFEDEGPVSEKILAGHSTCPTIVDWDKNGVADLLVGAEDGYLYYEKKQIDSK